MTTADPAPASAPAPSDAAAVLREAPLVRLLLRRDGDAVAAAGVLARALRAIDVPVQVAATSTRRRRRRRAEDGDPNATTLAIGPVEAADLGLGGDDRPAALGAAEIARELRDTGGDAAEIPVELALAGVHAAGAGPGTAAPELLEAARERGLRRRPGVALATGAVAADATREAAGELADGLAHATLFHAPFSGTPGAAADALADAGIDPDADPGSEPAAEWIENRRRAVASLVAVAATEGPAPERAGTTIERALRPHAIDGPAATIGGYADVLDVVAAADPGLAVAHAVGDVAFETLLAPWREASAATHAAVAAAEPARYDGAVAYDAGSGPPPLLARVARDSQCPEPVAVATGDDAIAIASTGPDASALASAVAGALDGSADGSTRRAVVRDPGGADPDAAIEPLRDAIEGDPA